MPSTLYSNLGSDGISFLNNRKKANSINYIKPLQEINPYGIVPNRVVPNDELSIDRSNYSKIQSNKIAPVQNIKIGSTQKATSNVSNHRPVNNALMNNMYSSLESPINGVPQWYNNMFEQYGPKVLNQRVPLEGRPDLNNLSIPNTNIPGIDIPQYSLSKKEQRLNKKYAKSIGNENVPENNAIVSDSGNTTNDRAYNRNVLANGIKSVLRNAPLVDSIVGYWQKKSDTPDFSGLENYKNYAMRETPVARYTANHITGNLKFNPYDYTNEANKINATSAAGQNLLSRQSRGNFNALASNINNMLMNTSKASGDAAQKAWQANEAQRMAVAQENRRADEFNANADNSADSAYITALNHQRSTDKQNAINALQQYDQQKYARNEAYKAQLDAKRNEMVSNIGEYGRNAFEANRANTNQSYNYWTDSFGRNHYISGNNGARPVENQVVNNDDSEIDEEKYNDMYSKADKDKRAILQKLQKQFGNERGRRYWYNYNYGNIG